jgi:hypothetical protein
VVATGGRCEDLDDLIDDRHEYLGPLPRRWPPLQHDTIWSTTLAVMLKEEIIAALARLKKKLKRNRRAKFSTLLWPDGSVLYVVTLWDGQGWRNACFPSKALSSDHLRELLQDPIECAWRSFNIAR